MIAATAILLVVAGSEPAAAQIDYRNLDDDRPVRTEDAYPIERFAFELMLPYEYENGVEGSQVHATLPELAYGVLPNTQIGAKLPVARLEAGGASEWGLAGPRLFALYNFNTEGRLLPALSLRADLAIPIGKLAGDDPRLTVKGIATRSWGLTRAHLNAAVSVGADDITAVEADPDWALSLAVDRTFFRRSLLAIGELAALRSVAGAPTEVTAALGARSQLTPTLVLDAGVSRRLTGRAGPDLGLTVGLSHAFSFAGLLPVRAR